MMKKQQCEGIYNGQALYILEMIWYASAVDMAIDGTSFSRGCLWLKSGCLWTWLKSTYCTPGWFLHDRLVWKLLLDLTKLVLLVVYAAVKIRAVDTAHAQMRNLFFHPTKLVSIVVIERKSEGNLLELYGQVWNWKADFFADVHRYLARLWSALRWPLIYRFSVVIQAKLCGWWNLQWEKIMIN